MTHALAEVVHVERFQPFALGPDASAGIGVDCPDPGCPWTSDAGDDLGQLLTAARRHVLEDHPRPDPLTREHAYILALHAVDNLAGNPYPLALIAEEQVPADDEYTSVRVCEATGNTVRGPLLPYEERGQPRRWICRVCFARRRRNSSHISDPLPLPADGAP